MLTSVDHGKVRPGAVTAVISGARPRAELRRAQPRYAGLDGRISDLDSTLPADFMPMISDQWTAHFKWKGDGPMPPAERLKLKQIVTKCTRQAESFGFGQLRRTSLSGQSFAPRAST